jgi:hypothetical protein
LGNEVIETLDGDLNESFFIHKNSFCGGRMSTKGSEPMAQPAFSGKDAILDAKALDVVRVARLTDLA